MSQSRRIDRRKLQWFSSPLSRFVLVVTPRQRNGREIRGKNAGSVSPFEHRRRTRSGIFNFSVCRVAWLPRVSSARDINRLGSADTTLYNQMRNTSDRFSNSIRVTELHTWQNENCSWRGKIDFELEQWKIICSPSLLLSSSRKDYDCKQIKCQKN